MKEETKTKSRVQLRAEIQELRTQLVEAELKVKFPQILLQAKKEIERELSLRERKLFEKEFLAKKIFHFCELYFDNNFSKERKRENINEKRMVMFLMHEYKLNYEIKNIFDLDRTTVLHHITVHDDLVFADAEYKKKYNKLKKAYELFDQEGDTGGNTSPQVNP